MRTSTMIALGLLGGGGAWTPASLSGLALWLDASDSTTLFQDSAKTTLATADGDPVGCWADKSGNGRDVTQATTANKPARSSASGVQSVLFDGGDVLAASAALTLTQCTVVAVKKASTLTGGLRFAAAVPSGSADWYGAFCSNGSFAAGRDVNLVFSTTTDKVLQIATVAASRADFWQNNLLLASDTALSSDTITTNTVYVGAGYYSGSVQQYYVGHLAEVAIFPRALDATERGLLAAYLATKWGITLS